MNDLISRQAVKEWLAKWEGYIDADTIARMQYRVIDIPSAQPEWIPCSERLPEKYGQYLVTFIPSGGTLWTCVLIARYSDLMGIAKPSFHVGTVGKNDFMNITEQVTAWMPLPEPYVERREE